MFIFDAGSFVYGLDCELPESFQKQFSDFAKGTDLLVFDGIYEDEEYPAVAGYGHGTWQQAADMTRQTGAKQVLVSHHKWERTDAELARMECLASEREPGLSFAREGMKISIG